MSLQTFLEKMNGIGFICISAGADWVHCCDILDVGSIPQELLERVVDRADFDIFNGYDDSTYISANIYLF